MQDHGHERHAEVNPVAFVTRRHETRRGDPEPPIDQTLTQDATGTLVKLQLEATGLYRLKTEVNVQYVDHNIIQEDFKNPDAHFLRSACQHFGVWYSRHGNGVSTRATKKTSVNRVRHRDVYNEHLLVIQKILSHLNTKNDEVVEFTPPQSRAPPQMILFE
jgi:hypothetical protein